MTILSPFVYWAQNEINLFIKVDLKDVKQPNVIIEKRKIQFQSKGSGAQGYKDYEFFIDLHSEIDKDKNNLKVTDHKVDLTLTKLDKGWWPRLTSQPQKPAWLKIDFDRWQSEDDLLDEDVRDVREDYPHLYDTLQKDELGYRKEDFKKVYLTLYNLFMYVGYMYIVSILCIKYVRDGTDFFPVAYETVGQVFCFMQLFQFLEVMHPLFNYVKGGIFIPLMQVLGRFFILFLMIGKEPRIQKMPVVFYLFLAWSAAEIIRYPYYMSVLYKKDNGVLTWLRYSAWIVLYPIGFTCEAVIVFRNLIFIEHSGKWSISMPNSLNFTFHFATFLRIFLLFIMIPSIYTLMSHMYKARKQKLGKKIRKIKRS
ncbi:hypothetical protein NQ317_007185 [Molorchus minor]|uniref:Very-long-chain (3R)-3-hydroxyacyl-CoA dehydratase n=1 Tax=Molorchus minor TaxID=1323400 RepID=A0ABQ9J788_9CUCU|nr:hypothetical protein NQ317_007185 [Molorchus minor]